MIGETWFTADLHLGHERILTLGSGRPFDSIAEHDETLIQNWNDRVGRDDVVWVLGDVAMGPIEESLAACRELNGTKYLVSGNHDRTFAGWRGQTPEAMAAWKARYIAEGGFTGVKTYEHFARSGLPTPHMLRSSSLPPVRVVTSHFPWAATEDDPQEGERYAAWHPKPQRGTWLLHGHVHDAWKVRPATREINVGVDVWDWAPVHSDVLAELIAEHA